MKQFRFPLEQVRRWRQAQLAVQQARLAGAAARVTAQQMELEAARAALRDAAASVSAEPRGEVLAAWGSYRTRSGHAIGDLERKLFESRRSFAAELNKTSATKRQKELLDRLRDARYADWMRALQNEAEALAAEQFLSKYSRVRPGPG